MVLPIGAHSAATSHSWLRQMSRLWSRVTRKKFFCKKFSYPPYSPHRSPLRPFAHAGPDHGGQHPIMETARASPRTPERRWGTRGTTGARSQSRTPPRAARRVIFRDETHSSHCGPSGRLRRPMSPTAEPQRQPKRPKTERTQIPSILPPTEQARLATLGAHKGPAEGATSSSSTAPSSARPGNAGATRHLGNATRRRGSGPNNGAVAPPPPP